VSTTMTGWGQLAFALDCLAQSLSVLDLECLDGEKAPSSRVKKVTVYKIRKVGKAFCEISVDIKVHIELKTPKFNA
jgi:hypothetical protein